MSDLLGLDVYLGDLLLDRLRAKIQHNWDDLCADARASVTEVVQIAGRLTLRKAGGEDVTEGLALAGSILMDWGWVGAEVMRGSLLTVAQEVAAQVLPWLGRALLAVITGMLA